jgi:uncharacterized membrane protein YgdD (TMEM256/DUF423 family)
MARTERAPAWRVLVALSGLTGAVGIAATAGASHLGDSRNLSAIAAVGLSHGPVLLVLGLAGRGWVLAAAAWLIGLGTITFAADLGLREWVGQPIFAGAAPLGGGLMILGWLAIAAAGATGWRGQPPQSG